MTKLPETNMNPQPASDSGAVYAPSWMCRIFGHKWWVTATNDRMDEFGLKHRDVTHRQMTHCDRCGIRNPACG